MASLYELFKLDVEPNDELIKNRIKLHGDLIYACEKPDKYQKALMNLSREFILIAIRDLAQKQICYLLIHRSMHHDHITMFLKDPEHNPWYNDKIKILIKVYPMLNVKERNYVHGERVHDLRILVCDWRNLQPREYQNFKPINFANDNQKAFLTYFYSHLTNITFPRRRCIVSPNAFTYAILFGTDTLQNNLFNYVYDGNFLKILGLENEEKDIEDLEMEDDEDDEDDENDPKLMEYMLADYKKKIEKNTLVRFKLLTSNYCLYVLIPSFYTLKEFEMAINAQYNPPKIDDTETLFMDTFPGYNGYYVPQFLVTDKFDLNDDILKGLDKFMADPRMEKTIIEHPESVCTYYTYPWSELKLSQFDQFKDMLRDPMYRDLLKQFVSYCKSQKSKILFLETNDIDYRTLVMPGRFRENLTREITTEAKKLELKNLIFNNRYNCTDWNGAQARTDEINTKYDEIKDFVF